MKSVKLPSGRELKFSDPPSTFAEAKALYEAVCDEGKDIKINSVDEVANLMKDVFCYAITSKEIEATVAPLLGRVMYDGKKITAETFESLQAREDYYDIIAEVVKENIAPFTKSLYAQFSPLLERIRMSLA